MSWRNFLTPYGDKYLIPKDEDSLSKISQNSLSPNQRIAVNRSKSSLDISQALRQKDASRFLGHNISNNNLSNNVSSDKSHNNIDEITYNISNTNISQDIYSITNNAQMYGQVKDKSPRHENKLTKIKNEMSLLKQELSKFPKKKKMDMQEISINHKEENQRVVQKEKQNPQSQLNRQNLQNLKNQLNDKENQQQRINGNVSPVQQNIGGQDLNLTYYDELSFSQNKQMLDHDNFITEDDIQQISNSLKDHLINYDKINNKLNAINNTQKALQQKNAVSSILPSQLAHKSTLQQLNQHKNSLFSTNDDKLQEKGFFFNKINIICQALSSNLQDIMHKQSNEYQIELSKHLESISYNLDNERQLRQQIQSQLMNSNEEIFRLNTQLQDLQNQLFEFKRVVTENNTSQKQSKLSISSSKRGSTALSQAEINGSSTKILNSHQQSEQLVSKQQDDQISNIDSIQHDEPQNLNSVFFETIEKQKSQISHLRMNRNQLLEALENVLKVISKEKSRKSESSQMKIVKNCMKQVKETKKIFKSNINMLRQEFLEIGHIEPLHLQCDKELDLLRDQINIQSQRFSFNKIGIIGSSKKQANNTDVFESKSNRFTIKQFHNNDLGEKNNQNKTFSPNNLKAYSPNDQLSKNKTIGSTNNIQNKSPIIVKSYNENNNTDTFTKQYSVNKIYKNNSVLKDSSNENLNYSHTDINSFYENLNETLNHTKGTILNTTKLNRLLVGVGQSLNHSKRNSINQLVSDKSQHNTPEKIEDQRFWDKPLQTNQQESNYQSLVNNKNTPKKLSLVEQYKQQQLEKQQQQQDIQQNDTTSFNHSNTPVKYNENKQNKNDFNERIQSNSLPLQNQYISSHRFNSSPYHETNYQTFQQQDDIDEYDSY